MYPLSFFSQIIAHFLIGCFFIFFGFLNVEKWNYNIETMKQKNIPFPKFVLSVGIAWQIIAGLMVVAGVYIKIAALLLIAFTIIAVLMFHSFWNYQGEERKMSRRIFFIHMTVTIGALLLLMKS